MRRAESAVAAEDMGVLKLNEEGFANYGEKEALAEQAARSKAADKERYGGTLPYLVTEFNKGGRNITAEMKRNKAILEGKPIKGVPYDSFEGRAIRKQPGQLGIQGDFMPDSEVRIHTVEGSEIDPLTGTPMIIRKPVMTEFMTDKDAVALYRKWKAGNEEISRRGIGPFRADTDIGSFNRFLVEYYGQQGLKLRGMQAPTDKQRSKATKEAASKGKATSIGTDRLLEMSPSMLDPEVRFQKDYRYVTPDGRVVVGDSQTLPNRDATNDYGLEIINASRMTPTQEKQFEINLGQQIRDARKDNPFSTIEDALLALQSKGQLPTSSDRVERDRGYLQSSGRSSADIFIVHYLETLKLSQE